MGFKEEKMQALQFDTRWEKWDAEWWQHGKEKKDKRKQKATVSSPYHCYDLVALYMSTEHTEELCLARWSRTSAQLAEQQISLHLWFPSQDSNMLVMKHRSSSYSSYLQWRINPGK